MFCWVRLFRRNREGETIKKRVTAKYKKGQPYI